MQKLFKKICIFIFSLLTVYLLDIRQAFALEEYSITDNFYRLVVGPFGTLVMVFCGLGGLATVYIRREGPAGKNVPMLGVFLIIGAIATFVLRIMITSGVLGFEYIDYNH